MQKEWLSDYCLEIANEHNIITGSVKKLVPNLMDKSNYEIQNRNLQLYLELGMKLKRIHRILKLKQRDWMKPYIDFNTGRQKEATNEADKNYFKLLNNAVFSKTMENMRKRIKVKIVKNEKVIIKYTSKPICVILVAIHEKKISLTSKKAIYVGFIVSEISKWEMYNFHYNFMIKKFDTKLLYTDSLCYKTHGKNSHKKMYKYKELFDLSNYRKSSKYYCRDNKKSSW